MSVRPPPGQTPPTTRTLPSGSSVAVWLARGVSIEPVLLQVPAGGSKISAVATAVDSPHPPAASTLPFGRRVVVCPVRSPTRQSIGRRTPSIAPVGTQENSPMTDSGTRSPSSIAEKRNERELDTAHLHTRHAG